MFEKARTLAANLQEPAASLMQKVNARDVKGLGRRLLRGVADALLRADPACQRVVAEPDVENTPSVRAFAAAGFVQQGELQLPDKTALLMVRPRTMQESEA